MAEEQKPFSWHLETNGPETYEQYFVPIWMAEWADLLIKAGNIGHGKRVLDAACGTGIVARKIAALTGSGGMVVGLDAHEGMITVARRCASHEGNQAIKWFCSDICTMPFSQGEFDVVICQQGLQFFPDKNKALQEMARVLEIGGQLVLGTWANIARFQFLADILRIVGEYCTADSRDTFRTSCSSFPSREDLRNLIRNAGFCNIHIRIEVKVARYPSLVEFLPAYLSLTPFAAEIASMQEEERIRMLNSIITALADYEDDDGLAIPSENHIVTADLNTRDLQE